MDEMKLKLRTRFMRNIVAKLVSKAIEKKLGYKVKIQLNDLDVDIVDGETKISTSLELKVNSQEFKKIIKTIGLDEESDI